MVSVVWGRDLAEVYDAVYAYEAEPAVLEPMLAFLAELAGDAGSALEFAVGTGRVALALSHRGVRVTGIELSPDMAERMRHKPGADAVPVVVGDMTSTRATGRFQMVYLVANSIMNVTTQDEQLAVFVNAAAQLDPGGSFVVEVMLPQLRLFPPGQTARVVTFDRDHIGIETLDDPCKQIASSHHWMHVDGRVVQHSAPYRYVWPAELDLMGELCGLRLRDRWGGWHREPFTAESTRHVSVYERGADPLRSA